MAPRWTEEMTIKFLELYRDHPCLWDQFSDLYKNKIARETALNEIVSAMNIEGFGISEAKLKIKALRATYMGELNKQEKSAKSGCGTADLYVPSVKWFSVMKFVMEKGTLKRDTKSCLVSAKASTKRSESTDHLENDENPTNDGEEENYEKLDMEDPDTLPGKNTEGDNQQKTNKTPIAPTPKRFKPRSKLQQIANTARELQSLRASIKQAPENEHDVFGKHVAAQLSKLGTRQAIIAMQRINSVLTDCRLAECESNGSSSASRPGSSLLEVQSPTSNSSSNEPPSWMYPSSAQTSGSHQDSDVNLGFGDVVCAFNRSYNM